MLLNTWQYARGYVTVEVTGFSVERFLNMAVFHGVYLWDLQHANGTCTLSVSIPGFKTLRTCAKKTNCKMRIKKKKGYPFIMHRYRRRKVLWGGILFFVLGLYALSSFIWHIDVVGRERLDQDAVLTFCESYGLKIGAFKYQVNHRQLQKELQLHFPEVAWADVYTRGTKTTITISETIPRQRILDKETPCHIIAAKDGLITGIVTGAGKPLVRQHDIVKQGEMLVSGVLELNSDLHGPSTTHVHAYAEVWAKRFTPITFTVPFEYTEKRYTGRQKNQYELQLLFASNKRFGITRSSVPFVSYDKITHRRQPGVSGNYPLPFLFIATQYNEFAPVTRKRNTQDAMTLADTMLTGRIIREFDFSTDVIDKSVQFFETEEGLRVEALITTNERIDAAVPINTSDGAQPDAMPANEILEVFEPFE